MRGPTASVCILFLAALSARAQDPGCWVYFGTSATDSARGIYRSGLDQATGRLGTPVFFVFSPDQTRLYALAEVPGPANRPREAIETYAVDRGTGDLRPLGERVSDGSEACHINIDPSGRCLLTTNYSDGYAEVFPIEPDGTVGPRSQKVMFAGSGPDRSRQLSAHPHSVNVDPTGRFAIIADLGQDKLFVYRLDPARAALSPNDPPFAEMDPGVGPRHFAFHPDGRHAFVINEMDASITAMTWNGVSGTLTPYLKVPILRRDYHGPTNTAAEVVVSRDGRFVYGSNRGADSLVVLAFNPATGSLSVIQSLTDGVKVPRNYAIDPSGRWLVCGNLTADTATIYRIDPAQGTLALVGKVAVPQPLCVRFLQR